MASSGLGRAWHDLGSGAARPRTDLCAGLPAPPPAPAPPWPSVAADPRHEGTEAVGNRVVGHGRCDRQHFTPLKRVGELQGSPLIPSSTPAVPSPPFFPSVSSAAGARLLQTLLALHGGRDYFKSSEEESWQAGAGQGSWRCVAGPGPGPGPGGSLRFPCAQRGFSGA